jgi:hypothetical protein
MLRGRKAIEAMQSEIEATHFACWVGAEISRVVSSPRRCEITMREAGLREELSVREMQQANTELALHRARVHAERELRAEDEAALAGLEDWRRGKATESLRSSFDDRLAQRVGLTQERLIAEAEARIGTRLIFGPSGPDGNVAIARPLSEMLAEAEAEPADETGRHRMIETCV